MVSMHHFHKSSHLVILAQTSEKWPVNGGGASLVPHALERSIVIRNDHMSAFPGHIIGTE